MPHEDQKLDSLDPGSREMEEEGRWEGQNFQQLKKVQRLEEEDYEHQEQARFTYTTNTTKDLRL